MGDFGRGFLLAAVLFGLLGMWNADRINDIWQDAAEDINDTWHAASVRSSDRCIDAIEHVRDSLDD